MGNLLYIRNIRELYLAGMNPAGPLRGTAMSSLPVLENAWITISEGRIVDFGSMNTFEPPSDRMNHLVIDAGGKTVLPSFCDSHTHLVYTGNRALEFKQKIQGLSYEEIARKGGGILNSSKRLRETSEEDLYREAYPRLQEIIRQGTGAVEIKSGYGLTVKDELKMLRVIKRLQETSPLLIRATFLGAHAIPEEYKNDREGYVNLVINEMIPAVAAEELADFIDVFCDKGFFTVEDTERILMAGMKHGMRPKIHANELDYSGGVQVGVKYDALSVDHLERAGEEEIKALASGETIATCLPGASFFLGLPEAPARKFIQAGISVAIASDFNPGSSPSGNMKLMLSLACIKLKMLPLEALAAATVNGAFAMNAQDDAGTIDRGKLANLIITKPIASFDVFPYSYGSDLIDTVILRGDVMARNNS
jgi:imidazolonepropionase